MHCVCMDPFNGMWIPTLTLLGSSIINGLVTTTFPEVVHANIQKPVLVFLWFFAHFSIGMAMRNEYYKNRTLAFLLLVASLLVMIWRAQRHKEKVNGRTPTKSLAAIAVASIILLYTSINSWQSSSTLLFTALYLLYTVFLAGESVRFLRKKKPSK